MDLWMAVTEHIFVLMHRIERLEKALCNRPECGEDNCSCWMDPPDKVDKNEGFEPSGEPK